MRLLRPETPLFAVGLVTAAVICIITAVIIWVTFLQEGLPKFTDPFTMFTLDNYYDTFFHPVTLDAAINTLMLASGTVIVSCFFAVPIAWLLFRTNVPYKKFFLILMFLHVLVPGFLRAMGWIMLISPEIGMVNEVLRFFIPVETGPLSPYNIPFMAFLQGLSLTVSVFLMIAGAFVAIDSRFEESAEVCGASRFQNLRRITVPLIMPALIAAAIYAFMTAASIFAIPALLGSPSNIHVFSTLMYLETHPDQGLPNYGIAGVYGVMLLIPTIIALFYYQKMLKRSHRYATVTGKGYQPKLIDLGRYKRIAVGFLASYHCLGLLLPFLALLWTSLVPHIQLPTMAALKTVSLSGYREAFMTLWDGEVLANTIQLVLLVGASSMLIGLIISWIVLRTRLPGRYALDTISMIPHAVPAVAFALSVAFIGLLLGRVVPLYGSLFAIILADTIRRIPFATRTIHGSLIQVHPELEEAVLTSGGSRVTAIRTVLAPLISPSLFYAFMWASLHAYSEVTTALFLQSPRNIVVSTAIWSAWNDGESSIAAAIGVIMVVFLAIILLLLLRRFPQMFGGRLGRGGM